MPVKENPARRCSRKKAARPPSQQGIAGPIRKNSEHNTIRSAAQQLSGDHLAALADLRERNRGRARLISTLRRIYTLGPRATIELILELAERSNSLPLLEELAERFARLNPDILRAVGGHEFPPSPIRLVAGDGR